ncbi:MAG: flagellar biosynthetic protein FliO [Hyphomicrobiales bacterium]
MPDLQPYLPWIITGAIVLLALILLFLVMSFFQRKVRGRKGSRLGISEYYEIDKMRRLVLIRRDETEHLLLIGGDQDLVIETGISEAVENAISDARRARMAPPEDRLGPDLTRPVPSPLPSQEPLRTPVLRATRPAPRPAVFGDRGGAPRTKVAEPRLADEEPTLPREDWDRDEPDQSSR